MRQLFPGRETLPDEEWERVAAVVLSNLTENGSFQAEINVLLDISRTTEAAERAVDGGFP